MILQNIQKSREAIAKQGAEKVDLQKQMVLLKLRSARPTLMKMMFLLSSYGIFLMMEDIYQEK